MSTHEAFNPLGSTKAKRVQQFKAACESEQGYTDNEAFWLAVYVLGIDCHMGTPFEELAADHHAPAAFLSTFRGKDNHHRILGSLKTVRRHWGHAFHDTLAAHGIPVDTTAIAITFAANLGKLATAHRLEDSIAALKRSLGRKYPGGPARKTATESGTRSLRNADLISAYTRLQDPSTESEDEEEGDEEAEPATPTTAPHKTRKRRVPTPERARRDVSGHMLMGSAPSQTDKFLDIEQTIASPITPSRCLGKYVDTTHLANFIDDATFQELITADANHTQSSPFLQLDPEEPEDDAPFEPPLETTPPPTMPPKRKSQVAEDSQKHKRAKLNLHDLQQELLAAHTAVQEAARDFRRAMEALAEVMERCYALPAPPDQEGPWTPPSTSAVADYEDSSGRSSAVASARLDTRIASLEEKQDDFEGAREGYAAYLATISTLPGVASKLPSLDQFQGIIEAGRNSELETLSTLRDDLNAAVSHVDKLKSVHTTKLGAYRQLQASWQATKKLREWEPEDIGDDVTMG